MAQGIWLRDLVQVFARRLLCIFCACWCAVNPTRSLIVDLIASWTRGFTRNQFAWAQVPVAWVQVPICYL